jgi:broad specificity phosphatase PhoE
MSLKLYLIRHGQTEWSLSGQHTGQTDLPLTAEGETQASQLAPILSKVEFSAVFTSPLQRARRTCELAGLARISQVDADLVEWNYGVYEGLTSEEILKENAGWNLFESGTPNGETPTEVSDRSDRLIERLSVLTGNVALFSHGHFFSAMAARWIGLPVLAAEHLELSTSSISTIGYSVHHPEIRVISGWNAVL